MVEQEVEDTLREIRERVRAASVQSRTDAQTTTPARQEPPAGIEGAAPAAATPGAHAGESSGALARLEANLSTTGRAWNRLPPLMSYRRGWPARLELWLKRLLKRAAHWFTWEQVNFNSAVHHALGDAREALGEARASLAAHGQTLERVEADLDALRDALRQLYAEAESGRARASEQHARLVAAEARFDRGLAQLRQALAAGFDQQRAEQRALADNLREGLREEQQSHQRARAAELRNEMRERVEHLLEEQRVCFKQLSLEAGEAAVMHDRARRLIEARLEALEKNVISDK
jgi:hypothetical protein